MKPIILIPFSLLFGVCPVLAVEYEADILPIFQSRCGNCHLDGGSKGGLALDLDRVGREIGSGKSIVPGDSAKSEILELVSLPDDDNDKMPPEGEGRPMSDREIAKLKEWIEAGAPVGSETPEMTGKEEKSGDLPKRPDPIDGSWTNTSGKTIQAVLVRVDGDKAILRMKGKDYPYPISSLTPDSRKIISDFAEAWKKASP